MCEELLDRSWIAHALPFLIIDPAMADFSSGFDYREYFSTNARRKVCHRRLLTVCNS